MGVKMFRQTTPDPSVPRTGSEIPDFVGKIVSSVFTSARNQGMVTIHPDPETRS